MKQVEAKCLIIKEWDRWVRQQSVDSDRATGRDSLKFYVELEDARSPIAESMIALSSRFSITLKVSDCFDPAYLF